jgi:hypothetical protein
MIKIPFFRTNFWQTNAAKVPIKHRKSIRPNLFYSLIRPIIGLLKRTNTSNLATMYVVDTESSMSVIQQLKLTVAATEKNYIRTGF